MRGEHMHILVDCLLAIRDVWPFRVFLAHSERGMEEASLRVLRCMVGTGGGGYYCCWGRGSAVALPCLWSRCQQGNLCLLSSSSSSSTCSLALSFSSSFCCCCITCGGTQRCLCGRDKGGARVVVLGERSNETRLAWACKRSLCCCVSRFSSCSYRVFLLFCWLILACIRVNLWKVRIQRCHIHWWISVRWGWEGLREAEKPHGRWERVAMFLRIYVNVGIFGGRGALLLSLLDALLLLWVNLYNDELTIFWLGEPPSAFWEYCFTQLLETRK